MLCPTCGSDIADNIDSCPICGANVKDGGDIDSLKAGEILNNRYRIIKKLGQGGFGITYIAYDNYNNREVVIKEFFYDSFCRRSPKDNKTVIISGGKSNIVSFNKAKERARQEAKTLEIINNQYIVKAYEHFEENNTIYIVMEYIRGNDLRKIIKQNKKLGESEALKYFKEILYGLKAIHSIGLIHRDIKPQNILIDIHNQVKIIDFGTIADVDNKSREITKIQSAGYAPIEINLQKSKIEPRYDIYSAGMTLYAMLSGNVDNIPNPMQREVQDDVKIEIERELNISKKLQKILLKCIEIKPEKRYQSVEEILDDLNKISKSKTTSNKPKSQPKKSTSTQQAKTTVSNANNSANDDFRIWKKVLIVFIIAIIVGVYKGYQKYKQKEINDLSSQVQISEVKNNIPDNEDVKKMFKGFEKTYGGSGSDIANAITPTKDGGYIVAGGTFSFGNGRMDVYLIKIDKNGNKIWQKTYGGSGSDRANAITPTKDGGYIVAGWTFSFGNGRMDVYLIKIDKNGNKIWQKTYGGSGYNEADAITPTKDGGYIVAGWTSSFGNGGGDVYLIKIDKNGNKIWQKTYGGSGIDIANAITPTKDGGYIVAGVTSSFGNGRMDVYLIKIDKNGNKIWQKTYGGSDWDGANAITPTKDGGYIVAGVTFSFGNGGGDVYLIKIDKNGNKIWQKTYGGSKDDEANAITPTKDGGYIVAGGTFSFGNGGEDVYLIKIDENGNKIWQKTYGGSKDDEAYAITPTKDGGYIVAGGTESFGNGGWDVYLIKIDKNGNTNQ